MLALAAKAALSLGLIKDGWNGFNVLHTAASRVGGLDLGLDAGAGRPDAPAMAKAGALDLIFNLGADEIDIEPGAFVVYHRHARRPGAHRADVILPGAAYTEKTGIYVNTEGVRNSPSAPCSRRATRARTGRSCARCPMRSAPGCRSTRGASCAPRLRRPPALASLDVIEPCRRRRCRSWRRRRRARQTPFAPAIDDFYLTNPIARASRDHGRMFGPGDRAPSRDQAAE